MGNYFKGYRVSVWKNENVLEMHVDIGFTNVNIFNTTELYI